MNLAIPFPDDLLEDLADALEQRLERRSWIVGKSEFAEMYGLTERQVEGLRNKGLPACNNRPLMFDLRATDEWFAARNDR
jgi:hypothetical protein